MTTKHANQIEIARLGDCAYVIAQAAAAGRVARGETPTWRENALEHAGDLARACKFVESRRQAKHFEEGI